MGTKRTWTGKHICFCLAVLILISFSGCGPLEKTRVKTEVETEARQYLLRTRQLIAQGEFEGALSEVQNVLSLSFREPLEDEALFLMGLIWVHSGNPKRDDAASLRAFRKLTGDFPQSPWVEPAKIIVVGLEEKGRLNQANEELRESLARLKQTHVKAPPHKEAQEPLLRGQRLLLRGDFEGALKEVEGALALSGGEPPGDESLFFLGLIYAHPANPKRDAVKSSGSFERLMKDYPKSLWAEQAKIWAGMLRENDRLNQMVDKLNESVKKLNEMIEKSKQVDIEIEEKKKREKGK